LTPPRSGSARCAARTPGSRATSQPRGVKGALRPRYSGRIPDDGDTNIILPGSPPGTPEAEERPLVWSLLGGRCAPRVSAIREPETVPGRAASKPILPSGAVWGDWPASVARGFDSRFGHPAKRRERRWAPLRS